MAHVYNHLSAETKNQIQTEIRSVILPFSYVKVSKSISIRQVIYFTVSSFRAALFRATLLFLCFFFLTCFFLFFRLCYRLALASFTPSLWQVFIIDAKPKLLRQFGCGIQFNFITREPKIVFFCNQKTNPSDRKLASAQILYPLS